MESMRAWALDGLRSLLDNSADTEALVAPHAMDNLVRYALEAMQEPRCASLRDKAMAFLFSSARIIGIDVQMMESLLHERAKSLLETMSNARRNTTTFHSVAINTPHQLNDATSQTKRENEDIQHPPPTSPKPEDRSFSPNPHVKAKDPIESEVHDCIQALGSIFSKHHEERVLAQRMAEHCRHHGLFSLTTVFEEVRRNMSNGDCGQSHGCPIKEEPRVSLKSAVRVPVRYNSALTGSKQNTRGDAKPHGNVLLLAPAPPEMTFDFGKEASEKRTFLEVKSRRSKLSYAFPSQKREGSIGLRRLRLRTLLHPPSKVAPLPDGPTENETMDRSTASHPLVGSCCSVKTRPKNAQSWHVSKQGKGREHAHFLQRFIGTVRKDWRKEVSTSYWKTKKPSENSGKTLNVYRLSDPSKSFRMFLLRLCCGQRAFPDSSFQSSPEMPARKNITQISKKETSASPTFSTSSQEEELLTHNNCDDYTVTPLDLSASPSPK